MFGIFKRGVKYRHPLKQKQTRQQAKDAKKKINMNQQAVYEALKAQQYPINGLALARAMGWDSASVTNRLAELVKKGRIDVAYNKKGLDGKWRKYYRVGK